MLPVSWMTNRIAIAAEGPSDRAILQTLCARADHVAKAGFADGKNSLFIKFDKILKTLEVTFNPTHFLVVVDLHPETDCPSEADRWRQAIRKRFPKAELCLSIWELESWLLADPNAVSTILGIRSDNLPSADKIGGEAPSQSLGRLLRVAKGFKRGAAYHKEHDGKMIAEKANLEIAARNSPSLEHFLRTIKSKQTTIVP